MKLLKLKLLTGFRGLQEDFQIDFSKQTENSSLNPICFVGPNGSGKSNVIEALAEVFYYLDSFIFNYEENSLFDKKSFGFEIEYLLKNDFHKTDVHVKVVKEPYAFPFLYEIDKEGMWNMKKIEINNNEFIKYLPTKIIGYSSGMNELVSNPFIKIKFYYYDNFRRRQKNTESKSFNQFEPRLFFMNYESNASILISNYLLQGEKGLEIFNKIIKIKKLHTFRLNIRLPEYLLDIQYQELFLRQIENLKKCATSFNEEIVSKKDKEQSTSERVIKIDYLVNDSTLRAFKSYFNDPFELYRLFMIFDLLNVSQIKERDRNLIKSLDQTQTGRRQAGLGMITNISESLPKAADEDLLFRISNLSLYKEKCSSAIKYKQLSDGEHQFMHIIGSLLMLSEDGTLFLLDEPETHLNPEWRSRLISSINAVVKSRKSHSKQQFIITTHSPFVLSDSKKDNVFIFKRNKNYKVSYRKPDIETFGTSINVLLEEAFNKNVTIADLSNKFIEDIKKEKINNKDDIENIKLRLRDIGESVEKLLLINYLKDKEKEITDQ